MAAVVVGVDGAVDGEVVLVALVVTTTSPLHHHLLRDTDLGSGLALDLVLPHTWPPGTTTVVSTIKTTLDITTGRSLHRPGDPLARLHLVDLVHPLLRHHHLRLAHLAPRQGMAVQDVAKQSLDFSFFPSKNIKMRSSIVLSSFIPSLVSTVFICDSSCFPCSFMGRKVDKTRRSWG